MPVWFWFLAALWSAPFVWLAWFTVKVGWWEPRQSRLAMADVEDRAEGLATSAHLGHHTFRAVEDQHEGPGHDDWSWPSNPRARP